MNCLALHDDVKFIIATHLASDLKIRALLSKNHDCLPFRHDSSGVLRVCVFVCVCVCVGGGGGGLGFRV
jgi:hypothetical protein